MTPENKLAKVREMATEWSKLAPPDDWGSGGVENAIISDIGRQILQVIDDNTEIEAARKCWCARCESLVLDAGYGDDWFAKTGRHRFIVCRDCGNKRCPRATWHENACTGSNATGQPGSSYEHVWDPEHVITCAQCTDLVATASADELDIAHSAAVRVLAQTTALRINNQEEPPQ